ncbi:MAG: acyl carrier protein [Anaerolineae bacterium]|nr:acyl carrier protein [Anaerolineae bacterium]
MENLEQIIRNVILAVAQEESIEVVTLHDSQKLVDDLGFKSLDLARILAILELKLGVDPFSSNLVAITDVRTVGDLCTAYRRGREGSPAEEAPPDLEQGQQRAEARRNGSRVRQGALRKKARNERLR